MGQITLYVDAETEQILRRAARESGLSVSKWVTLLIRRSTEDEWPAVVREAAGSWPDAPSAEKLRRKTPRDVRREKL